MAPNRKCVGGFSFWCFTNIYLHFKGINNCLLIKKIKQSGLAMIKYPFDVTVGVRGLKKFCKRMFLFMTIVDPYQFMLIA